MITSYFTHSALFRIHELTDRLGFTLIGRLSEYKPLPPTQNCSVELQGNRIKIWTHSVWNCSILLHWTLQNLATCKQICLWFWLYNLYYIFKCHCPSVPCWSTPSWSRRFLSLFISALSVPVSVLMLYSFGFAANSKSRGRLIYWSFQIKRAL